MSYNILVSKREKEGKKGKRRGGEKRERKKENIHIRLENPNGRKNTKGN